MPLKNLPTPIANPGEECGIAMPRVVAPISASTAAEAPQIAVKPVAGNDDILGIGRPATEVERAAGLLTKFGFLVVFAAAILGGSGVGMTVLWAANQNMVAASLKTHADQNKQIWEDAKERDKIAREDAREAAKQHREDRTKLWEAQRDLAVAIREQTRSAEDTHSTMKKAVELMSMHAGQLDKIIKKTEKTQ